MKNWFTSGLCSAALAGSLVVGSVSAQEVVKIGMVVEMTGPFAEFGRQMKAGIEAWQKQHGDSVDGRRVEVIYKDVGGPAPEVAKRLAQELIVQDKVSILAGFGFTPNAMAVAPLATQARVPMVVMNAASAQLTSRSPYMVRTSFGYDTMVPPIAQWALEQGHKKAYMIVADYAPGHDAEKAFKQAYEQAGGEIIGNVRVPLMTVDFAPYLQRVKDAKPDVLFAFVNAGNVAPALFKDFKIKGLDQAGIKLIGTGDIVYESILDVIGDNGLGATTVYPYSMQHPSELNRAYIQQFQEALGAKERPTIMSVSAYDGMALIYGGLKKAGPGADGKALLEAFKGLSFESPRGPVSIDPETHDIVQNQYIRRLERVDGELMNVEFKTYDASR
ncbi:MAG: ABC transporter substrate-binding protein [Alcaligenaceae bacterium]|nr:ABC transporter substrate-binding protein [Alcaligenaceae bacterium]